VIHNVAEARFEIARGALPESLHGHNGNAPYRCFDTLQQLLMGNCIAS
jgi:hypothetical protein